LSSLDLGQFGRYGLVLSMASVFAPLFVLYWTTAINVFSQMFLFLQTHYLLAIFVAASSAPIYWLWFCPLNYVNKLEEVGWKHIKNGKLKAEIVNRTRRYREAGDTPPAYPNGWFGIVESRSLKKGEVQHVTALGLNFAVYRGEGGAAYVVDAYCPHLGANLAVGGRIRGDNILCPYHNWSFKGSTGECTDIPYSKGCIPKQARLTTYPSVERNGFVYVWFHADQEEPSWTVPDEFENAHTDFKYQGRTEYYINCNAQDMSENPADSGHLNSVHDSAVLIGGEPSQFWEDLVADLCHHELAAAWRPGHLKHTAVSSVVVKFSVLGCTKYLKVVMIMKQIGPSCVHIDIDCAFGKALMIIQNIPVEPMVQKVVHTMYTEKSYSAPVAKFFLYSESIQMERDIRIWNSKKYMKNPLLVAEDSSILRHRRWYSQFYSESSHQQPKSLDW